MSSRTWGNGGINWSPGNVQASVYTVYGKKTEKKRRVVVNWHTGKLDPCGCLASHRERRARPAAHVLYAHPTTRAAVSDAGNFRNVPFTLDGVDEDTTVGELKTTLTDRLSGDVPPERMKLSRWGAEITDDAKKLGAVASAPEVVFELQVRRRQLPLRLNPADATGGGAAAVAPGGCTAVRLRALGAGGKGVKYDGVSDYTEIKALRAAVVNLPIAKEMWKAVAAAAAAAAGGDKKKKDAKAPAEGEEELTVDKLLLFAVGPDLEAEVEAGPPAGGELAMGSEGALLTTPRGGHWLVHLRDGKLISDYGLVNDSVVYLCLDK